MIPHELPSTIPRLRLVVTNERRTADRSWPRTGQMIIADLAEANDAVCVARASLTVTTNEVRHAQQARRDATRFLSEAEANLRRLADELETASGRAMGT